MECESEPQSTRGTPHQSDEQGFGEALFVGYNTDRASKQGHRNGPQWRMKPIGLLSWRATLLGPGCCDRTERGLPPPLSLSEDPGFCSSKKVPPRLPMRISLHWKLDLRADKVITEGLVSRNDTAVRKQRSVLFEAPCPWDFSCWVPVCTVSQSRSLCFCSLLPYVLLILRKTI